jgi:hypothetical protein
VDMRRDGIAVIRIKESPDMFMLVSKVPGSIDRDALWKDTLLSDPSGAIQDMLDIRTTSIAAISEIQPKTIVGGRPIFYVSVNNSGLTAYRVGYWLEEDDAISAFAVFPEESNFKNELIDILINHIEVSQADD